MIIKLLYFFAFSFKTLDFFLHLPFVFMINISHFAFANGRLQKRRRQRIHPEVFRVAQGGQNGGSLHVRGRDRSRLSDSRSCINHHVVAFQVTHAKHTRFTLLHRQI